ncbi:MAG: dTDP-4-dehydrorhamnose 3,5-epimerase [Blastomonas sp.]
MQIIPTEIPEVKIIVPRVHGDERGFFLESWNAGAFRDAGMDIDFVQDNHSRSARGVLRGIHYQITQPQGKLVRVVRGKVFDVAVDLRRSAPSFGKWVGVELSETNKRALWIPPGFAHGFVALEDDTDFLYKCSGAYVPSDERCVMWDDPDIGIAWPLGDLEPLISGKDRLGTPLADAETYS